MSTISLEPIRFNRFNFERMCLNFEHRDKPLNNVGLGVQGTVASVGVNGLVHPISTYMRRAMAGNQLLAKPVSQTPRRFEKPTLRRALHQVRDVYKGIGVTCILDTAIIAATFGVEEKLHHAFSKRLTPYIQDENQRKKVASLFSSIGVGTLVTPLIMVGEGIATNAQVNAEGVALKDTLKRSCRPAAFAFTLGREVPFTIKLFLAAPIIEKGILQLSGKKDSNLATQALSGAIAGGIAGYITTPFELLKVRAQTSEKSLTMRQTYREAVKGLGIRALFNSGLGRVVYVGGALSIMAVAKGTTPRYLPDELHSKKLI